MAQVFYNNVAGFLNGVHAAGVTSLTLQAGHNFPDPGANYYLATLTLLDSNAREIAWEIVRVTDVATNTLTVTRAQEGTTALEWASGTRLEVRLTAASLGTAAPLNVGTGATEVAAGNRGVTNGDSHDHSGGDGAQIAYANLSGLPTLGTAAAKNIPATGNASATEVVYGSDTRLSDARAPASHTTGSHSDWPAGVSMTELGYLDGVTSALQTQLDGKLIGRSTNLTVTVGSGGDYATINAALVALSKYYPLYVAGGFTATVNLLAGFTMNELVVLRNGLDLGWITITGADASTSVAAGVFTGASYYTDPYDSGLWCGLFEAHNHAVLPVIDQKFIGVATGTGSPAIYTGVVLSNGSQATIAPGAGFSGLDAVALVAVNSSLIAEGAVCVGGDYWGGIICYASTVVAPGITLSGGFCGVYASSGGSVNCVASTITGCEYNIYALLGGRIAADVSNLSGADVNGCLAKRGSFISASMCNTRKGATDSTSDTVVSYGSIICFTGAITGGISQTKNVITAEGIIFAD